MAKPLSKAPKTPTLTPLLCVGGGAMGSAILAGALENTTILNRSTTAVIEPDASKRRTLKRDLRIACLPDLKSGHKWLQSIPSNRTTKFLLAIKPQMLSELAANPAASIFVNRTVLSILAGVPAHSVESRLPGCRCVRIMPNLAAAIGLGTTAIASASSGAATTADRRFASRLFKAVGAPPVEIPEELMDAFTAVAGSGPAYLFLLAESMEAAARSIGLSEPVSRAIVRSTLAGAAIMLEQSTDPASLMRDRVTSKRGTTAAALEVLERGKFVRILQTAITAARDRGRALAAESALV